MLEPTGGPEGLQQGFEAREALIMACRFRLKVRPKPIFLCAPHRRRTQRSASGLGPRKKDRELQSSLVRLGMEIQVRVALLDLGQTRAQSDCSLQVLL